MSSSPKVAVEAAECDERARRGGALVGDFLRRRTMFGDEDQAVHGKAIAALHQELSLCGPRDEASVITDAVVDVLHHADGWHNPEAILTRAFELHWTARPFVSNLQARAPQYGTSTRDRDALAGTVACLYAAAAVAYGVDDDEIADRAELAFLEEIEAARWEAVRQAREG